MVREIRTGEETDEADAGWLLISDGLSCLRVLRNFVSSMSSKKG